ncbi:MULTISPECIES: non-canonical purine NTP pyrophosphatase [Xanthomonas]|uniref:non-canonical purine NTP pyrophosphatase n=1 Tax=Xanthomonas TaxID=338 RepID=UPI0023E95B6B|nr:non-canonical purine NTP pyrophosphatase [Xanthomonas sp. LMC-A-07]MCW2035417.1 dephospho-CoA kinase/inosine/xanthosine triphosphate pyrophosphatase family protein [Xanthomonas campestris]
MTDLWFLTTSAIKLSHFRHLARETGISISSFHERTFLASYSEPRLFDRDVLLRKSYESALAQWKKAGLDEDELFFIEDTSVIIGALSKDAEFPGLDVKFWMRKTTFSELDSLLKSVGNDRSVSVRSDIILHLPTSIRIAYGYKNPYVQFTGISHGSIVNEERDFDLNPLRPWQDNKTFNKWFVPEGELEPLSALLPFVADRVDFRRRAFDELLKFLERLGLPAKKSFHELRPKQPEIPGIQNRPPLFIIVGLSGAGKTTLAEGLVARSGYMHFEASDFMRWSYYERLGGASGKSIGEFAKLVIEQEPWTVPEKVLSCYEAFADMPAVITGFRSPLEISYFIENYANKDAVEVIYLHASQRERYKRLRLRARGDSPSSLNKLSEKDREQKAMGLEGIKKLPHHYLVNMGEKENMYANVFDNFNLRGLRRVSASRRFGFALLQDAIIMAMGRGGERERLTTTEISKLINAHEIRGLATHKDNVSRYFNQRRGPYFDMDVSGGKYRYSLSQTGRSYYVALISMDGRLNERSAPSKNNGQQLDLPFDL